MDRHVDAIVVGGGSAGCVLASRLSEDADRAVLLLEAGPDYGPADSGNWPEELNSARYQPGSHDWGYTVTAHGRTYAQFRARVIGGCSTINAAGITWPSRFDLDRWAGTGLPGWGFDDLAPYIARVEADARGAWPGHGRDGYLPVVEAATETPVTDALRQAMGRRGIPELDDYNDPDARSGMGRASRNVVGQRRIHLAAAYLDPARSRPNLQIEGGALVHRVEWDGNRAVAVVYSGSGEVRRATADRIVLAAGSFGTPAILQRSGIGDADYLRTILPEGTALHHLPGVGQNLWEQPGLSVDFDPADGAYARLAPLVPKVGMFGSVVCKVMSEPDLEWFDTHLFQRHVMAPPPFPGLSFAGCQIFLLDPAESGFTRITSDDPEAKPEIAGGAGHPRDVERLARVIEMEREIMASPELREWVGAEMKPGAAIQGEELRRWVYDNLELYHHACGTAKLGPAGDPLAVAGADARVHGFDNLFVGDASAIPHIPRAAVHMPVLGIAEKVSDLIRGR